MDEKTRFVPVRLSNDELIQVEVTPFASGGATTTKVALRKGQAADITEQQFQSLLGVVKVIGQSILATIKEIHPQEATVEFGIELGVEAGQLTALLVKGTGTSTMKISLTWKSEAPQGG